ncbi:MAG: hypothetical protein M3211_08920 [Actinomycetota bacterium]|nr:hypothetical protein [Actinomycetota bacterium]
MFEIEPFSQLPGPGLAAELAAADPHHLDDDTLAAHLQAAKRLEAWSVSLLGAWDLRVRRRPPGGRPRGPRARRRTRRQR